uniref:Putative venom protein n=1 Tax=Superstitionia donensis TaxID=311983 RepID=A0A1V1WBV3_9SCOR
MLFRIAVYSLLLVVCVYSLSCPLCWENPSVCGTTPTDCKLGLTKDACGCCDVCYKIEGEKCGGPWRTSGNCGKGLKCEIPKDLPKHIQRQAVGTCKPE